MPRPSSATRSLAVDRAVRPDRVPAPAGVAPEPRSAPIRAEVAQAEHGLEAGVLFAEARPADVEAAHRQTSVEIPGQHVPVLGSRLPADLVGLGEEGEGDRPASSSYVTRCSGGSRTPARTLDSPSAVGRWPASISPPTTLRMAWLPALCGLKNLRLRSATASSRAPARPVRGGPRRARPGWPCPGCDRLEQDHTVLGQSPMGGRASAPARRAGVRQSGATPPQVR